MDDFPLFVPLPTAEPATPPAPPRRGRTKSPAPTAPASGAADAAGAAPRGGSRARRRAERAAVSTESVSTKSKVGVTGRQRPAKAVKTSAATATAVEAERREDATGPAALLVEPALAGPILLRTALGVLHHGCGVTWLESCPAGSVDLIVADPPYNMGKAAWDRLGTTADYVAWTRRWVGAAHRALTPTGTLYVMGWSELLAHVQVAVAADWHAVRWLVWAYRNKANLKDDWGRSHESILHLRKSKAFTFETDAVRVPYNGHTTRYPERSQAETSQYGGARAETWRPHPLGARPRDVIEVPVLANGTAEKTAHPTQKPVQLIRRLVLASSRPGDLVVDPFAGSGTTALVAETHGRRWASSEADPTYGAFAARRIADPSAHAGLQTRETEAELAARRGRLR